MRAALSLLGPCLLLVAAAPPRGLGPAAQDPAGAEDPAAQDPTPEPVAGGPVRVELESLDGRTTRTTLRELVGQDPRRAGGPFLRFPGLVAPEAGDPARTFRLTFEGGRHVTAEVRGGDEERLALRLPGGSEVRLGLDALRALESPRRLDVEGVAPEAPEEGDRLYLARGRTLDRVDGLVLAVTDEGVSFETRVGERTYPWDEVAALYVEALDEPEAAETPIPVRLALRGGGTLSGGLGGLTAEGVELTLGRHAWRLSPRDVAELAVEDGTYAFLSDLPPSDLGPLNPFDDGGVDEVLGQPFPPRVDRAVTGGPLVVRGREHPRGLGVHAPSRVTWTLDGSWKELRGSVAVDDSGDTPRRKGHVRFSVRVDGEVRWTSPELRGGEGALTLPELSLEGATELVLEVDPMGDWALDRADWLRPLLVR